jgi:hypothetical protein
MEPIHGIGRLRLYSPDLPRGEKMEKELYRVKVILFVMAENESAARVAATQARFDIFECAAKRAENVDAEWNDSIPYNADDDRTCQEIMTTKMQTARPKARPAKLPAYVETGIKIFEVENRSIQPWQQT